MRAKKASTVCRTAELLWASVREVLNIFQADQCGCHIVTVPHDILAKALKMSGMGLAELSLDTVKMFDNDAKAAVYTLNKPQINLEIAVKTSEIFTDFIAAMSSSRVPLISPPS